MFLDGKRIEQVKAATVISVEGLACDQVYLVVKGSLQFYKHLRHGDHKDLQKLRKERFAPLSPDIDLGERLLERECSLHDPLLLGDEPFLLGINQPFSVVSASHITIIACNSSQFFGLL